MAKNRRNKRNKQDQLTINEKYAGLLLPGMLMSVKRLIEFGSSEWKTEDSGAFVPGIITSAAILGGHCAELLLKYKIGQEGLYIRKTHDLYDLYKTLNNESKAAIQKEFDELKLESEISLRDGWDSAESVFRKARKASFDFRYVVELNESTDKSIDCDHRALYIAAVSVYKTTSLNSQSYSRERVTDPEIKRVLS